ncbi:GGDEF domain-containing protein [Lactococcus garvieae]|jgi:diguanylate cyclase (GGDEF)-like protein|uniref:GGDEF domain-containing protein n=1 Tax=Lactococcus garvieae TaxID=1363 RepID=UPI0002D815CC|nr:GGDEF domain-containing protein [Lactococcus garvieae]MBS4463651.1 GGDEF domain-containing protein [Lactococcus garvieae]MCO7128812.1 GGDEF domain-containing protein [Lactococcus garvieae]MDB7634654.1 GGDEF domain-containing protein [Lactococcus garvieae]QSQ99120.1 GGDEF domain-containing protein [Lactococcus garvieae]UHU65853.1 diguanylate cyclase [Lactococcus garvieae]
MMDLIKEILGPYFFAKLFLIPAILGGIFLTKNIIHRSKYAENPYSAFWLYSSNFTLWILFLKLLFIEIVQSGAYGYLLSDISLIFIAIAVDYCIVTYYEKIEYAMLPLFTIFYLVYIYSYGFHWKSILLVTLSLGLFLLTLYFIAKNQRAVMQSYGKMMLIGLSLSVSVQLLFLSEFAFSWVHAVEIFGKTFILLVIAKFILLDISSIVGEYAKYKRYTYIDALTNIYNRRKFEETMDEILASDQISKFSLVFFDIDNFKHINDHYGHSSGDYVLKEICVLIKKYLRETGENGQLFRYGGDEFFLLFRNRKGEVVRDIMEQVAKEISEYVFHTSSNAIKTSISVGAVEITDKVTRDQAIYRVDKHLYIAKENGKNQVYFK